MRRSFSVIRVEPILFFFNDTATTEIYTLSLHDALPISRRRPRADPRDRRERGRRGRRHAAAGDGELRSEEHTSELQSRPHLVCRLLLEKKKKIMLAEAFQHLKGETSLQAIHCLLFDTSS